MTVPSQEYIHAPTGVNLQGLPKISLHDHLDGGLRPETILELADGIDLDLPAEDAESLREWFAVQSDSGSLVEYLKTFDVTTAVMQTSDALVRIAREFVQDLAADGVIYGEIRWAPEQHIRAGQLVTAMRHADRGLEIAELATRHRHAGVVGFDFAGAEAGFPPSRARTAFDYLATEFFPVTVHAGEADGLESIRSALLDGRALRLGHGVRLAEDITIERQDDENTYVTLGALSQWVKDREIALETSP